MKNYNLQIKRDAIGIMPIDVKKRIISDIKKMVLDKKLSNPENKQLFDEYVKSNPDILVILQEIAFNQLVRKIADECDEFNTSEYLIDKYKLDANNDFGQLALYPLAIEIISKYIELDSLVRKYDMYSSALFLEIEELNSKIDEDEEDFEILEEDVVGPNDKEDNINLVNRVSELEKNMDEIDEFVNSPNEYADRIIDTYEDKLFDYIVANADTYVDSNVLISRLINDMENSSTVSKIIYLSTISDYIKKYKKSDREINSNDQGNKTR